MKFGDIFIKDLTPKIQYSSIYELLYRFDTHFHQTQVILLVIARAFVFLECNAQVCPSFCRLGYFSDV